MEKRMFTGSFWLATLERAIKTFAQSLVALLVAAGTNLLTTDWPEKLAVAGMAALLSVLTSIGSDIYNRGKDGGGGGGGPSLGAEVLAKKR
jgi:hypothetical protein